MALTQSAPSLYSDIFRFKAVYTITLRGTDSVTGLWFDSKELLPPSTNPSKSNQTTANPAFETGQFYAKMDGLTAWNKNDSLNVDPVIFQYNKDIDNNEYADSSQFYYSGYTVTIANPKDKTSTREMPVVNVNSDFPKFLTSQNLLFSQVVLGSSSFPGTSAYSDSGPGAFRLNPTDVFNVPPSAW